MLFFRPPFATSARRLRSGPAKDGAPARLFCFRDILSRERWATRPAITNKNTVYVGIEETFKDPQGNVRNTAKDAGGGTTLHITGTNNAEVILSKDGNKSDPKNPGTTRGADGGRIPDPVELIAAHEVLAHGLETMRGGDISERKAREIENQFRKEQGLPLREVDPNKK